MKYKINKAKDVILPEKATITELVKKVSGGYNPLYYYPNKLFSYDPEKYWFYIVIGSRGRGKTVSAWRWVLKRFLNHGERFIWLRLTETPIKKAARNASATLIPKFLMEQLGIKGVTMKGASIYLILEKGDGIETVLCGIMDSISTFYTTKGNDMSAFTNVVFDEINRESGERNTFDVTRAFINQIETIARMRKIRVLMMGNTITDTSEILSLFNFQPKEFGLYRLTRKKTIIEYLADSDEFLEARKNSMAGILLGAEDDVATSFTNKAVGFMENVSQYTNKYKPLYIYYIGEFKSYGIYTMPDGRYFIGDVRHEDLAKYKISPFMNCEGVYSDDIYKVFYELISVNQLVYETTLIRSRFTQALKYNRTAI